MADVKTAKITVSNTTDGPKVLNAYPSAMVLAAGETADVEMTEAEAAVAIVSEWFAFAKPGKTEPEAE